MDHRGLDVAVQTLNTPTGKYLGFDRVHILYHYLRTHQDSNYNTMRRDREYALRAKETTDIASDFCNDGRVWYFFFGFIPCIVFIGGFVVVAIELSPHRRLWF